MSGDADLVVQVPVPRSMAADARALIAVLDCGG